MPCVRAEHVGLDSARSNAVDSNAFGTSIGRERSAKGLNSTFGTRVKRMFFYPKHVCSNRGHKDDAATTREVLHGICSDEELSAGVETKDTIIFFFCHLLWWPEGLCARIVDDDVYFTEMIYGFLEELSTSGVLEILAWIATALPPDLLMSSARASAALALLE